MRQMLNKCSINGEPQLRQTLIKYNNMTVQQVDDLKQRIINNLNVQREVSNASRLDG